MMGVGKGDCLSNMAIFGIYVKFLGGTFQSLRVESDNNVQEGETPPCFRNFRIVQVASETSGLSIPHRRCNNEASATNFL